MDLPDPNSGPTPPPTSGLHTDRRFDHHDHDHDHDDPAPWVGPPETSDWHPAETSDWHPDYDEFDGPEGWARQAAWSAGTMGPTYAPTSWACPSHLLPHAPPHEKMDRVVHETAVLVRRAGDGGTRLELRVGIAQKKNPLFAFLDPKHRVHRYYRYVLEHAPTTAWTAAGETTQEGVEGRGRGDGAGLVQYAASSSEEEEDEDEDEKEEEEHDDDDDKKEEEEEKDADTMVETDRVEEGVGPTVDGPGPETAIPTAGGDPALDPDLAVAVAEAKARALAHAAMRSAAPSEEPTAARQVQAAAQIAAARLVERQAQAEAEEEARRRAERAAREEEERRALEEARTAEEVRVAAQKARVQRARRLAAEHKVKVSRAKEAANARTIASLRATLAADSDGDGDDDDHHHHQDGYPGGGGGRGRVGGGYGNGNGEDKALPRLDVSLFRSRPGPGRKRARESGEMASPGAEDDLGLSDLED